MSNLCRSWRILSFVEPVKVVNRLSENPSCLAKRRALRLPKARGTRDTFYSRNALLFSKHLLFSDKRLTTLTGSTKDKIRQLRHKFDIHPSVKQIDTLAAEYPAETNYLYLTYNGESDDVVSQRSNVK